MEAISTVSQFSNLEYEQRDPVVSYYSGTSSSAPFYSLSFAFKIAFILAKKTRPQRNTEFQKTLSSVSKELESQSGLWGILYALSNDGDLLLLDEPFTALSPLET